MHERVNSQSECTKAASKTDWSHFQRQQDRSCHNFVHRTVSGRCFPSVAVALAKELLWLKIQKSSWKHKSRLLLYFSLSWGSVKASRKILGRDGFQSEPKYQKSSSFLTSYLFQIWQLKQIPLYFYFGVCFYYFPEAAADIFTAVLRKRTCVLFCSFSAHYLKWVQPCRTILFYGNCLLLLLWSLFLFHVHLL